jgi:hypothetical protein
MKTEAMASISSCSATAIRHIGAATFVQSSATIGPKNTGKLGKGRDEKMKKKTGPFGGAVVLPGC